MIYGNTERISREAPVLILEHYETKKILGAASNAAHNVSRLNFGKVSAIGVYGDDYYGKKLLEILNEKNIKTDLMVMDETRKTTTKTRISGSCNQSITQQIVRIDRQTKTPLSPQTEAKVIDNIKKSIKDFDGVILSDYHLGCLTDNVVKCAIEEAKNAELWQFISALGIPLIGSTYAKEMCKREYDWFNIREDIAKGFDFAEWDGFGPEMNSAIHNFDYCEADYLVDEVLHLKNSFYIDIHSKISVALSLSDKKIVITGKLNKFKNRDELKVFIERSGGKVVSSISKSTDMLINNDINSESSKNIAAKKLGIPIITEEEFISQYLGEIY